MVNNFQKFAKLQERIEKSYVFMRAYIYIIYLKSRKTAFLLHYQETRCTTYITHAGRNYSPYKYLLTCLHYLPSVISESVNSVWLALRLQVSKLHH